MFNHSLIFLLLAAPVFGRAQQTQVTASIEKGKLLARPCVECHASPDATLGGPLQGIRKIRSTAYLYSLLKNPMQFADKNKTAKKVFAKRGLQMPPFPGLTKADIKAILDYFDSLPAN